jgi:ATP-dependent RNA helicase RhlE
MYYVQRTGIRGLEPSRGGNSRRGDGQSRFGGGSRSGGGNRFGGGASRGPSRGGNRFGGGRGRGRGGPKGDYIDVSRFINKAVVTEQVEVYTPKHTFADFAVDNLVKRSVIARGYNIPTPIQDTAIPHIIEGKDLVGIANTGTGKTGAFLVPLLNKIISGDREMVIILAPTRELAIQIDQELKELTVNINPALKPHQKIHSVCCVGGMPIGKQIRDLKYLHNFVIGTPGRIKDLIDRKCIFLSDFKTIVLDEADRMLDMGFINDMRAVMAGMPKGRQTLFFSATLSPDIERLIHEFLNQPVRVSVKTGDTAKNVDQDVIRMSGGSKIDKLHELLSDPEFSKVIIFGRTKHGVEKLAQSLIQKGHKVDALHGDKNHSHRQRALGKFKDNFVNVLVATDVAARGLDIPNVSHVINFDIPGTYEDYVHRIGRTGRGGKTGKALTFID